MELNRITGIIIEESIEIHRDLGPGLLESVYEAVLARRLGKRGLQVRRQVPVPLVYDGETYEEAFRIDLLVEERIVVELKSVALMPPVAFKRLRRTSASWILKLACSLTSVNMYSRMGCIGS